MAEVEAERERKEKEMERNRKMEAERLRLEALQKVCYMMQDQYSPPRRILPIFLLVKTKLFYISFALIKKVKSTFNFHKFIKRMDLEIFVSL